jgi:hypothetical protein
VDVSFHEGGCYPVKTSSPEQPRKQPNTINLSLQTYLQLNSPVPHHIRTNMTESCHSFTRSFNYAAVRRVSVRQQQLGSSGPHSPRSRTRPSENTEKVVYFESLIHPTYILTQHIPF